MKKQLVTYLLFFISLISFGQDVNHNRTIGVFGRPYLGTYAPKGFGSSSNVYGLLNVSQTVLSANQELNAILFTNRQSATWKPQGFNSGWVYTKWSTNMGVSWDSLYIQHEDSNKLRGRYPSGVILNPPNNTNITDAAAITSGPITSGAGWVGNYFSSINLVQTNVQADSSIYSTVTNSDTNFALNSNPNVTKQQYARNYLSASSNVAHIAGVIDNGNINNIGAGFRGASINKAELTNTGNVTWTIDSIKPPVKHNSSGVALCNPEAIMAWSKDGNIGYVVFYGVDENAVQGTSQFSYQPITYKTTDAGISWNRFLPLFDWNTTALMQLNTLTPINGNPNLYKAFFNSKQGVDAIVDAKGDLHIITEIYSSLSDNVDSLQTPKIPLRHSYIYDVHTESDYNGSNNNYCVTLIDTLWSMSSIICDNTGDGCMWSWYELDLSARLQISRSDNGKALFYCWQDSDTSLTDGYNASPDLYIKGYDVAKNSFTSTYNITHETSETFFMYASDISLYANGAYTVPLTHSNSLDQVSTNVIHHAYIDNAVFDTTLFNQATSYNCLFTGTVTNVKADVKASVYPNPTTSNSELTITLDKNENVVITVYNTTGAIVTSKVYRGLKGYNSITLNSDAWENGIYFYNVKSNTAALSGKLIVQK